MVFIILCTSLYAQQPVCSLSDNQTQKAIKAFGELSPIFTDPRCLNCHGGVSPFGKGIGEHPENGFKVIFDRDVASITKTFAPCQECHGAFPDWRIPTEDAAFTNKTTIDLCKQMKVQFPAGALDFLEHMTNDKGNVPFLDVAFAGTMGLNQDGVDRATVKIPDPVKAMSRNQMLGHSHEWVDAMGGKFHQPDECGCSEMQYALRVRITGVLRIANFLFNYGTKEPDAALPVIPIHFKDDGSLSGDAIINTSTTNTRPGPEVACVGASGQLVHVTANGKWRTESEQIEDAAGFTHTVEHAKIDVRLDANELSARSTETCETPWREASGGSNKTGNIPYSFNYSFDPIVGATQAVPWNVPIPGWAGEVQVTLIRTK